jgi:DeoR/GlpR family transcriptional regulator of sugar metabolism
MQIADKVHVLEVRLKELAAFLDVKEEAIERNLQKLQKEMVQLGEHEEDLQHFQNRYRDLMVIINSISIIIILSIIVTILVTNTM